MIILRGKLIVFKNVSSDSDEDGDMGNMWSDYLKEQNPDGAKSKAEKEEEAYVRKRSRDILTTMYDRQIIVLNNFSMIE